MHLYLCFGEGKVGGKLRSSKSKGAEESREIC